MTSQPRRPVTTPSVDVYGQREHRVPVLDVNAFSSPDRPRVPGESVCSSSRPLPMARGPAHPPPRRVNGGYRRPVVQPHPAIDRTKRRFLQLVVCLGIFGVAILFKIVAPESAQRFKETLSDHIGGGPDYKAAFSTVGQVLTEGGDIGEVWEAIATALFGGGEDQMTASEPPSEILDEPAVGVPETAANISGIRQAAPSSYTLGAIRNSLQQNMKIPQLSGWEVSLSEADALDDTAPVPFGLAVPVNVDYTYLELPFETVTPVFGRLSSDFGYRDHPIRDEVLFHYGLDIAAPTGTDIRCFADGVVIQTGVSDSYGQTIEILHDGGLSTFYAHCSRILADERQTVKKGEVIARVGMTGSATGPHLHLEMRRGNVVLNPGPYITTEASV